MLQLWMKKIVWKCHTIQKIPYNIKRQLFWHPVKIRNCTLIVIEEIRKKEFPHAYFYRLKDRQWEKKYPVKFHLKYVILNHK